MSGCVKAGRFHLVVIAVARGFIGVAEGHIDRSPSALVHYLHLRRTATY